MKKYAIKKAAGIFLTASLAISAMTMGVVNSSALFDEETHRYTPAEGIETYRYYFAMPKNWYNSAETLGIADGEASAYWWSGTDKCKSLADVTGTLYIPGYTMHKVEGVNIGGPSYDIFYIDCPQDVPAIIFGNNIDGGTDKTKPEFFAERHTPNVVLDDYFAEDATDDDVLNTEVFDYMIKAVENRDDNALGVYKNNCTYYEDWKSYKLNFNNMIYVAPLAPNDINELSEQKIYKGEWYFLYDSDSTGSGGSASFGNYPTKEAALEHGKVYDFADFDLSLDVDESGNVDIGDATFIQKYLAGFSGCELADVTGDVNADGSVSIQDVTHIQKYLAGLI